MSSTWRSHPKNSGRTVAICVGAAVTLAASCSSATSPASPLGVPVALAVTYTPVVQGPESAPAYQLAVRSTFVNLLGETVYVHQWCDETFGSDTATYPWVSLVRVGIDSTKIAYETGGCYLDTPGGPSPVAPYAVAPGDSITTDFIFPAIFNHIPTASDSVSLTGMMELQYVVTSTSGLMDKNSRLIPVQFRTSAPFQVILP
jgi:hypothetical protein